MGNSFSVLRSSYKTYRQMVHTARMLVRRVRSALLAAILLYKLCTLVLFLPAIRGLWALALRLSPTHYFTNNNLMQLFASPSVIIGLLLIALLSAFWGLYEFSLILHGIDAARRDEKCRLLPLFRRALVDIRHAVQPRNWPILLYSAVLVPFSNLFLTSNFVSQLAVPEYIMGVIRAKPLYFALYLAVFAAGALLSLFWILVFPLFTLERKNLREAARESTGFVKGRFGRLVLLLAGWNLSVFVRAMLWVAFLFLLLLGVVLYVGIEHTQAMLALSRAVRFVQFPYFYFLIDCSVTVAQCSIIGLLYDRFREKAPLVLEKRPDGRRYRTSGRMLLALTTLCVTLFTCLVAFAYLFLPSDSELRALIGGNAPVVTFHRGDSSNAPENTLPAFQSAIDKGGDFIELDVQMTKDGVVVVTHDANLQRCTGRNAKVYDLTYAEVAQLDAGRWFGVSFTGTKIPTLEEVLALCKGKINLNIEIKPSEATPTLEAETVRLIRQYGFEKDCVVTSTSYPTLCKVKELAPQLRTGYILAVGVGSYYDLPAADFFSVEATFITSGMVQQLHLRGKTVSAWTIDRAEDARRMLELCVDDIITDDPEMVRDLLSEDEITDEALIAFRNLFRELFFSTDSQTQHAELAAEDPDALLNAA